MGMPRARHFHYQSYSDIFQWTNHCILRIHCRTDIHSKHQQGDQTVSANSSSFREKSFWLDEEYTPNPSLETNLEVDVAILGGG